MGKRLLLVIISIVMLFSLAACGGKSVDVEKMYEITSSGADGYGRVSVNQKSDYLFALTMEAAGVKKDEANPMKALEAAYAKSDKLMKLERFLQSINYKLAEEGQNGKYKNGDSVTITITADEELGKAAGYSLSKKEIKHKIEGLKEAEKVDPFESVTVKFEGYSERAHAVVKNESKLPVNVKYSLDKQEKLKNGDKVTVTAEYDEQLAVSLGYILFPKTKEFTVADLRELKTIEESTLKDGYELEYAGALPNLSVTVLNKLPNELKSMISYDITQNDNKLGGNMVVKVTADEYVLEEAGYILPSQGVEFTEPIKEGVVPYYINDLSQLDDTTKGQIIKQFGDLALAQISKGVYESIPEVYYKEDLKFEKIDSLYLLSTKPNMDPNGGGFFSSHKIYNQLTGIVKVSGKTGESRDKMAQDENLYLAVLIDNIIKNPDGTCSINLGLSRSDDNLYRKDDVLKEFIHAYASNYNIGQLTYEEFKPKNESSGPEVEQIEVPEDPTKGEGE